MNIIQKTLSNGLRVIFVPQPDVATVTAMTLFATGSNKETLQQNGLSHFLEHVCFKATKTRPNAKMINEAFEEIGAITNAFTSDEYTGYYAKSHSQHATKIIELVADVVCNATFPEAELEKEKGVIVEEINMYEDMPQAKVLELLSAALYGDTAAGRAIIGTKDSVRAFTRDDVVAYKSQYYVAENAVLAIVGSYDEAVVLEKIEQVFSALPKGLRDENREVVFDQTTLPVVSAEKPIDQTHIAIGFPSVAIGSPEAPALTLLANILGGGMSSRLFHHLREELGVAYYVRAEQDSHSTYGEFVITAGIDTTRVPEVLSAIAAVLKEIRTTVVPEKELIKAKEFSIGMLGMGLETTDMLAGYCSTQLLLTGDIKTPDMVAAEYRAVTIEDILRVAQSVLDVSATRIAVVGPSGVQSLTLDTFL